MKTYLSFLSIALAFALISCSGKSSSDKMNDASTVDDNDVAVNTDHSNTADNTTAKVHVYGIDNMKYVVDHKGDNVQTGKKMQVNNDTYYLLKGITAQAGEKLTIQLTTISKLPASAMSHNWCLLKNSADPQAFAQAGASAKQNDYIAPSKEGQVIKETGMVSGGNSATVSFSVPEKTGDYEYVCTFPGHFASGMKGTLTVQ